MTKLIKTHSIIDKLCKSDKNRYLWCLKGLVSIFKEDVCLELGPGADQDQMEVKPLLMFAKLDNNTVLYVFAACWYFHEVFADFSHPISTHKARNREWSGRHTWKYQAQYLHKIYWINVHCISFKAISIVFQKFWIQILYNVQAKTNPCNLKGGKCNWYILREHWAIEDGRNGATSPIIQFCKAL